MIVNREELLQKLELIRPGLSPREIIEQSSSIIFKDGHAKTYNDEIACSIECKIGVEGAVQALPLITIISKLEEETIKINQGEGELLIRGKRRKAGIRMDHEILLPVDCVEIPEKWKKLKPEFTEAIRITQQCTSTDESRFELTCIHINKKFIEACDRFQFARYPIKIGIKNSALVRSSSIKHVVNLNMSEFSESEDWIHFRNELGLILSCRQYIEEYPNMDKFFDISGEAVSFPKGLKQAADKAEVFSIENTESNQVTVELSSKKIKITGKGSSGWYSEIKKFNYEGKPISFLISPKLLGEIINNYNKCEIARGVLKVDGESFTYITCLGEIDE